MPDPYTMGVVAGGELRASNAVPGSCYGYITHAPTMQVTYNGGRSLFFYTNGSTDTTLAIRDAQGNWRCSDDELGTDAGLGYRNATRGTYDVWVGSYSSSRGNTQLMVSEISMGHGAN